MNIKEHVFKNKQEMVSKMDALASAYEGAVPGRNGYNFPNKDGSYTIAYVEKDFVTKMHEMRHAMYFFDDNYRTEVQKLWESLSYEEQTVIEKFLNRCGYKKEFFLDEFQAYMTTEKDPDKFFGLKENTLKKGCKLFKKQ
jgi:hypothetical protein